MAGECIVKVPKYSVYDDYDFIGFSFNGYHCIEDLNVLRVNGGSMYSENLTPQIQEKSGQHPGIDGAYLLDVQHRQRVFDVNIAFDSLTDEQLRKLKTVFAGKEMGELWFDEYPYKVWDAKVTGQPMLKVIPFGEEDGPTIYKGEGTIQFTAYYPYAHTPDYVYKDGVSQGDGCLLSSYDGFNNINQWSVDDELPQSNMDVNFELTTTVPANKIIEMGSLKIEVEEDVGTVITWNSRTGIVYKTEEKKESIYDYEYVADTNSYEKVETNETTKIITPIAIKFTGRSFGTVPTTALAGTNAKYHYWYY